MHNEQTTLAFAWVKQGAPNAAAGGGEGVSPPATGLVGRWQDVEDGSILVLEASGFVLEIGGQRIGGTYRVESDRIVFTVQGRQSTHLFQLEGDQLALKNTETGEVSRMRRLAADAGAAPEPPPETPAGNPLVGKWKGDDGSVLVCTATDIALYEDGELVARGTYRIRGDRLRVDFGDGVVEEFVFEVQGNSLTTRDAEGDVYRYRRTD